MEGRGRALAASRNDFSAPDVVRIATLSRVSTSFFVGATFPKKAQYSPKK